MDLLEIKVNSEQSTLLLEYLPKTEKVFYDICDVDGRVIQTGEITNEDTSISLGDKFHKGAYLIWVVDGDEVSKGRFKLK